MVLAGAILFFILAYKNRRMVFLSFLLFIYALSFSATVFLQSISDSYAVSSGSFAYLQSILLVLLYPYYGKINIGFVHSNRALILIGIIFSIVLTPATFFYGYYGILTFLNVNLSTARIDAETLLPANMINTFFSIFSTLYFVPMFLFFVFYKERIFPKLRLIMLLSTLSFPLLTLCYSGRDGMLFWTMNMVMFYLLFKETMGERNRRTIRSLLLYGGLFLAFFFIAISIARFSDKQGGTVMGILNYLGQQSRHFSVAFDNEFFRGYDSLFPGWRNVLGIRDTGMGIEDYAMYGFLSEYNVFGFYVKTLIGGYGKIGAFIVAIIIGVITRIFMRNFKKRNNIIDFLFVVTLFQIPMNGLFYYRQGIGNGDIIYSVFLVGLLVLKIVAKNNRVRRLAAPM